MLGAGDGTLVSPIANPSFEDGLQGWSIWPEGSGSTLNIDTARAVDGEASLRIDAASASDRAFVNTTSAEFERDVLYRLSVAIRRDDTVPESAVGYLVNYRDANEGTIKRRAYPMNLRKEPIGDGWERWSGLFICSEDAEVWQVLLRVEHTVGSTWFDDLRVERLGPIEDLRPDVWSYLPVGIEIGTPPLQRFNAHREEGDEAWHAARRYNALLMSSALVGARVRDVERCYAYAGEQPPAQLRLRYQAMERRLNEAYHAFADAFLGHRDWRAVRPAMRRLQDEIGLLSGAVVAARDAIAVDDVALPANLGRQPAAVPPFSDDGQMNRLLIGEWSPTSFVELERPFEFEFHSAAPGSPAVHTESERRFTNITEACDTYEALGFRGTFGYLHFGIHDLMYAPNWFIEKHAEEPDLFKVSWDGLKGRSRGSDHSLNYFHPAVKQYIRDYLSAYARFCAHEPRILFHEIAQEAYPLFNTEDGARRESGYGPSALAAFHDWLAAEYGTIDALNEAWGTDYASFVAIEPPPDRYVVPDREITPLVAEFERFREDGYLDYLQLIYDSLKAGDPSKPVAARHGALLASINGARAFEHCDVLSHHSRAPRMQVMHRYLNTLSRCNGNRPLAYLEDFWGVQEEADRVADERVMRASLEKHVARTFAWGRVLQMKWYAYSTAGYLTTYNGNWFNPRYDLLTMRYCAPGLKVALDRMRNVDWLLTHSSIPQFRLAIWQPSASMRVQRREGLAAGEISALHELLYPAFEYEIVPEEYFADGRADLASFDVVILPAAEYLSEAHQRRLVDYARSGGTLIAFEPPGVRDELTRPSGLMLREIFGIESVEFDPNDSRWRYEIDGGPVRDGLTRVDIGSGEAMLAPTGVAGATEAEALRELLEPRVRRHAWSERSQFEIIPRIDEDGRRYLFVLNPSPDERRSDVIRSGEPVRSATDISVPGGYPVAVRPAGDGSAMDVTLGPGEMAILWLR